jgi:hypothetical protein
MGSLDDNALKNELAKMQQRLLSALQHGDEQVHSFLLDWDRLKQHLIHGLSTGRVSEETKKLAAEVARHVALIAQSFLKLEQVSGVLTKDSIPLSTSQKIVKKHGSSTTHPGQAGTGKTENDNSLQCRTSGVDSKTSSNCAESTVTDPVSHVTLQQEYESDHSDLDTDCSSESDAEELLSNIESIEDAQDPNWDVLRDWMLSNISAPFLPTGPEANELERKAAVDFDGLVCWIESTRNQCGWSSLLAKYAHGDINKMRDLCIDIFRDPSGTAAMQSYPQELVNDFLAMREYLRGLDTNAPSTWWTEIGQMLSEVLLSDVEDDADSIWTSDSMFEDMLSQDLTLGDNDDDDSTPQIPEPMDSESELQAPCAVTGRKRKADDDITATQSIQERT